MAAKVVLPEMGEGVIEGTLSRWLVKEGDHVEVFDPIAEVETDKVTTETTTDVSGTILKLCVAEGEEVPVGAVLAYIGAPGEAVDGEQKSGGAEEQGSGGEYTAGAEEKNSLQSPVSNLQSPLPQSATPYVGRISPVVGRIAAEHHVDLSRIHGTGRDGRITKKDIFAYVEQGNNGAVKAPVAEPTSMEQTAAAPTPVETKTAPVTRQAAEPVPTAVPTPTITTPTTAEPRPSVARTTADELLPLTGVRRSIAEHMVRSKHTSPHVTSIFEFDFAAVAAHREANKEQFAHDGVNLTYTAYIVAATAQALKQYPIINSTWSDEGIVLRKEINIGVAAAIDDGLIVPVIKHADELNLLGLARAVNDLTLRARNKQLKPAEVQGGTFSITNHGTSGSLFATPIINQPQCGILGVGKIEKRVKVINDAIAIRPLAYIGLTFDHRILDGATADHFVSTIKDMIENWR